MAANTTYAATKANQANQVYLRLGWLGKIQENPYRKVGYTPKNPDRKANPYRNVGYTPKNPLRLWSRQTQA